MFCIVFATVLLETFRCKRAELIRKCHKGPANDIFADKAEGFFNGVAILHV